VCSNALDSRLRGNDTDQNKLLRRVLSYINKVITMSNNNIQVLKADGSREFFDSGKLEQSLRRTGVSENTVNRISDHIQAELINDMSTSDIYRHAFSLLAQSQRGAAVRYSLRRALAGLGPSGFPFEDYMAELFKARGWQAETGRTFKGKCVPHEVDVVAWKKDELVMAEVKFHNELGYKTDLKVALYVKARMDDLSGVFYNIGGSEQKLRAGYLITNTKFTETAIQYGLCAGLNLLGWNYPDKGGLEDLIEEANLHPLSCLTTLTNNEKKELFGRGVVLCRTIVENKNILTSLNISEQKMDEVISEASSLF